MKIFLSRRIKALLVQMCGPGLVEPLVIIKDLKEREVL